MWVSLLLLVDRSSPSAACGWTVVCGYVSFKLVKINNSIDEDYYQLNELFIYELIITLSLIFS